MKYVEIRNKGTIPFEFIELLGAGEAREAGKIRYFHTGAKYALAAAKRMDIDVRIYSGTWKLWIDTEDKTVAAASGDVEVRRVMFRYKMSGSSSIKTSKSGFTLDIGPNWSDPWYVIREFMANAIDAGGFEYTIVDVPNVDNLKYDAHHTRVYIQCTPKVDEIIRNLVQYVRLDAEGYKVEGQGRIMPRVGPKPLIYNKGVRVMMLEDDSLYDYELDGLELTEERTVKSFWDVKYKIARLWEKCTDQILLKNLIENRNRKRLVEHQMNWYTMQKNDAIAEAFKTVYGDGTVLAKSDREAAEVEGFGIKAVAPDSTDDDQARNSEMDTYLAQSGVQTVDQVVGELFLYDFIEPTEEHAANIALAYEILEPVRPNIRSLPVKVFKPTEAQQSIIGEMCKGPETDGVVTWYIAQNADIGHDLFMVTRNILHEANHHITKCTHGIGDFDLLRKQEDLLVTILTRKYKKALDIAWEQMDEGNSMIVLPGKIASRVTANMLGSAVPMHILPDRILVYIKTGETVNTLVLLAATNDHGLIWGTLTMNADSVVITIPGLNAIERTVKAVLG